MNIVEAKKIKNAVSEVLAGRHVADSSKILGSEFKGKLSDMTAEERRDVFLDKVLGHKEYEERVWSIYYGSDKMSMGQELGEYSNLRQNFFSEQLADIQKEINERKELSDFKFDDSKFTNRKVNGKTLETKYNEYQAQLNEYSREIDEQLARREQVKQDLANARAEESKRLNQPVVQNELRDRFKSMSTLDQPGFQREWNNLSEYEKTLYQEQVGAVDTFRDSSGNLLAIQDGNQNQLASLDDKVRSEYETWLVNRDNVLWNETNQFAEAARAQRLLNDRQRLSFERGEKPVQEEMSGYTPVGESPEGGQIEAATDETNEITMAATEERVVGERGAAQIERRSMSNILATDTAASYAFGYRQKALLGVMGTVGVISLLEANSHGGGREALERKRQLEEQRRMKKYGY